MQTASLSKMSRISRAVLCLFILIALTGASAPMAAAKAVLDFDGDGKTDYLVLRRTSTISSEAAPLEWYVLLSDGGVMAREFGLASNIVDRAMPEDYDGDGKCDFAVYRVGDDPLVLYYLASETNTLHAVQLDGFQHADMTQDYDGDGKADPAQARVDINHDLVWRILESTTGNIRTVQFGRVLDVPLRGDYDGDGKADFAIYRKPFSEMPYHNTFFIIRSSDGEMQSEVFGNYETDRIISADFDGDRKTDIAVWRRRVTEVDTGYWYWIESSTGIHRAFHFGIGNQDLAIPGDYDGDGKTDIAVSRYDRNPDQALGKTIFYVNRSTGGMTAVHWGNGYDFTMTSLFAH